MKFARDSNCVFCQIVAGSSPASKFYEDDEILGFMILRPKYEGECLVIPKKHIDHFMDIDHGLSAKIMTVGQKVAQKIREEFKPDRVGFVVSGYGVSHAHLIVLPSFHPDDITSKHYAVLQDGEIRFSEKQVPLASREELDRLAALLRIENVD